MTRYIDADLFKAELNMGHCTGEITGSDDVEKLLDLQPTADVKEVVRGKWVEVKGQEFVFDECTVCGKRIAQYTKNETKFCSSCGADMREVE